MGLCRSLGGDVRKPTLKIFRHGDIARIDEATVFDLRQSATQFGFSISLATTKPTRLLVLLISRAYDRRLSLQEVAPQTAMLRKRSKAIMSVANSCGLMFSSARSEADHELQRSLVPTLQPTGETDRIRHGRLRRDQCR